MVLFRRCFYGGLAVAKAARVISILVSLAIILWLLGCSWGQTTGFFDPGPWTAATPPSNDGTPSSALGVLNWTAGLSIIGGVIGMVLGSRAAGMRAIMIGALLVILSYAIAAYAHLILLPIGIILSIISAIWGYSTIISAWRTRS